MCPNCKDNNIYKEVGHGETLIYRCWGCGYIGTIKDFETKM